jgi:hypothetical protein
MFLQNYLGGSYCLFSLCSLTKKIMGKLKCISSGTLGVYTKYFKNIP